MRKEELQAMCDLKLQRAEFVCKDREKYAESVSMSQFESIERIH